ncbi:MAG: hypothetical protein AAGF86_20865, partial [Pseudomonadota bacterium]
FTPAKKGRPAQPGVLSATPGLSDAGGLGPQGGPYPYARLLYAVPTVGKGAKDHSQVLAKLAEAGLSYRTVSLDRRDGMPVALAIDVPSGHQNKLRPVLKALHRLPGAQRLAVFPSVTPMIADGLRPQPTSDPRVRLLLQGAAVIALALAGFVGLSMAGILG